MTPRTTDTTARVLLQLLLLLVTFFSAALCWWSVGRQAYIEATFYFVLCLIAAVSDGWVADPDPTSGQDEQRRRGELGAVIQLSDRRVR